MLSFRIGAALLTAGGLLVLTLLERVSAEARDPIAEPGIGPATNSEESFAGAPPH